MFDKKEFEKYAIKHQGISSASLHSYTSIYNDYISPTIIEERQLNVASMDVFSRLMMITGAVVRELSYFPGKGHPFFVGLLGWIKGRFFLQSRIIAL